MYRYVNIRYFLCIPLGIAVTAHLPLMKYFGKVETIFIYELEGMGVSIGMEGQAKHHLKLSRNNEWPHKKLPSWRVGSQMCKLM